MSETHWKRLIGNTLLETHRKHIGNNLLETHWKQLIGNTLLETHWKLNGNTCENVGFKGDSKLIPHRAKKD